VPICGKVPPTTRWLQCEKERFRSRGVGDRKIRKTLEEEGMNWDQIEGNWKQFKGQVRQQWGKLTDDELDQVEGQREELVGRIQEKYGIARDEAERQVRDWEGGL
jgi:uncharacterized protein YjbJ (UPF0337 family)